MTGDDSFYYYPVARSNDLISFLDDSFGGRYEWDELNEFEKQSVYDIVKSSRIEDAFNSFVAYERERFDIVVY